MRRLAQLQSCRAIVLGVLGGLLVASEAARAGEEPITVRIAVPLDRSGRRTIDAIDVEDRAKLRHFHVVVDNIADVPVRLWREWCSWGYYNLTFEVRGPDGKIRHLRKGNRKWAANSPDWCTVPPGEQRVIDVHWMPRIWRLGPLQDLLGKESIVKVRPVFSIDEDPDKFAAKNGVWTGRVHGPWIDVRLRYRKIAKRDCPPATAKRESSTTAKMKILGSNSASTVRGHRGQWGRLGRGARVAAIGRHGHRLRQSRDQGRGEAAGKGRHRKGDRRVRHRARCPGGLCSQEQRDRRADAGAVGASLRAG